MVTTEIKTSYYHIFKKIRKMISGHMEKFQKVFLLMSSIGLLPIALSYGLIPEKSMSYLYDIEVTNLNLIHIFRAVMGLYLSLIIFWLLGAFNTLLREAAILSLIVFMFGLAFGRIVSLILDGIPNWLLLVYLGLELSFGIVGVILVKK